MTQASGIGLGFRMELAEDLLATRPRQVQWVEVHPENYMRRGGRYPALLEKAREAWPVVTHGLTMSFGCVTPFEPDYLKPLRAFLRDIETPWHSDHMCFGGADGVFAHDLLPLPFTEEAADVIVRRLTEARDALDLPLAIENVSYYAPSGDPASEPDFLVEVLERADALLLLDVNNVFVNSQNHGFDPRAYIDKIPKDRVVQMHIAGHMTRNDGIRIDTHGESVCNGVYDLLEYTLARVGPKPLLLERDNNIPPLADLLVELDQLHEIYARATGDAAGATGPAIEVTR